jgi:hypothetical protein
MADLQGSALMRSILNAQPTPKTSPNSPAASPQGEAHDIWSLKTEQPLGKENNSSEREPSS